MKITTIRTDARFWDSLMMKKDLHFQWVYGFLVLGGLKELPLLIRRQKVSRVIIVSESAA